ncbi:MAG: anthranilate synthase component I [Phycisphaeraceae bacterium]|nr:anthranilate synthase component I [Phycisphaeraceae bacterium]
MSHDAPVFDTFARLADGPGTVIPVFRRLFADQLTPVLAYRRLVTADQRLAPSFLFESVEGGERIGRYSYLGSRPEKQVIARGQNVITIGADPAHVEACRRHDPLGDMHHILADWILAPVPGAPDFTGGWVGYAGYDTVRYLEGEKLPNPPPDDRRLPDLHMQLYRQIVAFDHVQKTIVLVTNVLPSEHASPSAALESARQELDQLQRRITSSRSRAVDEPEIPPGEALDLVTAPPTLPTSNMGKGGYQRAVEAAKQYIRAGDIFQVVPSQRFELTTRADPFDLYRALRVVNPSPYMFYLQIDGGMLVGSSPEILCRVKDRQVTNRPLAGTRHRGPTQAQDNALEQELLSDPKDRAEHIMLVDLGRNDVGRVAVPGSISLPQVMTVERYSHVMHISSTVVGRLRDDSSCWDALRYALPVGTVSGAPKVRAMQIIDELETTRRGPYAGAVGYVDFAGNMDMAIALRTMVVTPTEADCPDPTSWKVHIQAGGGIVADSDPDAEHQETLNKAAALAKAVDLAQRAFSSKLDPAQST